MRRGDFASCALMLVAVLSVGAGAATAAPSTGSSDGGAPGPSAPSKLQVVSSEALSPTRTALFINSPAMGRTVQVQLLQGRGTGPRPTVYLLDGLSSPAGDSDWIRKTDIEAFFANKPVNVVLPVGGEGTYYTDWARPDPRRGVNNWETFLTQELPDLVDSKFDGNGRNVIGGLSMGGQAAMTLITRHPDLYRGVVAFSTCPDLSEPNQRNLVRGAVASQGGDATNMWGPEGDPLWAAHDPYVHAENLRGKTVLLTVGSGIPGIHDFGPNPDFPQSIVMGAPLENAAMLCTAKFKARLVALDIPAQVDFKPIGTHAWPYWQDDLHASWPTIATALGL